MILKCIIAFVLILLPFMPMLLFSHDKCYKGMEKDGHAKDGCCCGQAGGNASTDYLNACCCDCKHLKLPE